MGRKVALALAMSGLLLVARSQRRGADSPILFNTNFEGGSLGKIETLGENRFRCLVAGQYDERGRNRQANWYYFCMEGVKDRDIALTLTDLVGEYDDRPGACPMTADTIPVFSDDNEHWQPLSEMAWDDVKKEATLQLSAPATDRSGSPICPLPAQPLAQAARADRPQRRRPAWRSSARRRGGATCTWSRSRTSIGPTRARRSSGSRRGSTPGKPRPRT